MPTRLLTMLFALGSVVPQAASTPAGTQNVDRAGRVEVRGGPLPFSLYASEQAASAYGRLRASDAASPPPSFAATAAIRAYYARQSRDFTASSLSVMQRRLVAAGRSAELVLFDGMWHLFFVDPDLPESREAYAVVADFFDRKLAGRPVRAITTGGTGMRAAGAPVVSHHCPQTKRP